MTGFSVAALRSAGRAGMGTCFWRQCQASVRYIAPEST